MPYQVCRHYIKNDTTTDIHVVYLFGCCNKVYSCMLCHNHKEDHDATFGCSKKVICVKCENIQEFGATHCNKCRVKLSDHKCDKCKLHFNRKHDHCDKCGKCADTGMRIHCDKCGVCYGLKKGVDTHNCVKACEDPCAICMDDDKMKCKVNKSAIYRLGCAHIFHQRCIFQYFETQKVQCPICRNLEIKLNKLEFEDRTRRTKINCERCSRHYILPFAHKVKENEFDSVCPYCRIVNRTHGVCV